MGKLAIIGLGLIGTSMGLAIRRTSPDLELSGFDRIQESGEYARQIGAVDILGLSAADAVKDAGTVVVATPIINMRKVFEEIGPALKRGCLVTDTASTKVDVLRWADELLPQGVTFVGGHPMAGKEQTGPGSAEAGLFEGRPYVVVPSTRSHPAAVDAVFSLAQEIGSEPFFLDAAEHDAYAAGISHTPLVASIALFNIARNSNAWPELARMSGPAFRDLTRLASGSTEMAHDILLTNRENVLHWIERYTEELRRIGDLIEKNEAADLYRLLAEAQIERENFLINPPKREEVVKDVDTSMSLVDLMVGSRWKERSDEMTKALEERVRARSREERLRRRE
jgi:prephenate dehydrogenase